MTSEHKLLFSIAHFHSPLLCNCRCIKEYRLGQLCSFHSGSHDHKLLMCISNISVMLLLHARGFSSDARCCPARFGACMVYVPTHATVLHHTETKPSAASTHQLWLGRLDECALGAVQNVERIAQRANARHAPRVPHKLAGRLHLLPANTTLGLGDCSALLCRGFVKCGVTTAIPTGSEATDMHNRLHHSEGEAAGL